MDKNFRNLNMRTGGNKPTKNVVYIYAFGYMWYIYIYMTERHIVNKN